MAYTLLQQIGSVRRKANAAIKKPRSHQYLPYLIEYLDLAEEVLRKGPRHSRHSRKERGEMLGGFGRILLDDYRLAESELGCAMINVMNRFYEAARDKRKTSIRRKPNKRQQDKPTSKKR
jgi:hypothetical protein